MDSDNLVQDALLKERARSTKLADNLSFLVERYGMNEVVKALGGSVETCTTSTIGRKWRYSIEFETDDRPKTNG